VIENTNEMVVETTPDSVYMGIPDVSHMRSYMTKYYTTAVKSLFRKHQLLINKKFPRYHVDFSFSKEEQQNWFDLFHVKGTEHQTPFTYFTTSGTMVLMQLVGELGINFKNLRHLKSEITYNAKGVIPACETTYSLQAELDDIVQLREDRVMIITKTMVYDDAMFLVNTNKDFFIILNLEPEYLQVLKSLKNFGRHDSREFQHLSHKETVIAYCPDDIEHRFSIDVPEDMGFQYGKISGDLNMVHTTRMAAKLFGHPKPFIQGLCTANYVLKSLIACGQGPLLNFTITFSQPAFVGETIDIFCSNTAFEVCDSEKKVLAFGNWEKVT
jgi:acyl dehydratase